MASEFTRFLDTFAPVEEHTTNATLNALLDTLIPAPPPPLMETPKAQKVDRKRKPMTRPLRKPKQPRMEAVQKPKRKQKKAEQIKIEEEAKSEPIEVEEPIEMEEPITIEEMKIVDKPIEVDITDNCNGLPRNVVVNVYMCDRH